MSFLSTPELKEELRNSGVDALFPEASTHLSPTPRNRRKVVYPEVITFPKDAKQVAQIVEIGKRLKRRVVALSGGHSSIGNSIGGSHGALVISLEKLNKVEYNPETQQVKIQTGITLGEVDKKLAQWHRVIPHGTCPTVGIGGHSAFGGFGNATRMWGLNCDNIESMEVVRDNGDIENISKDLNPSLFWAMRGAAPSFAIATELTYRTYTEIPSDNIHTIIIDSEMSWQHLSLSFQQFQNEPKDTLTRDDIVWPKELSLDFIIEPVEIARRSEDLRIHVRGVYYGTKVDYELILEKLKELFDWKFQKKGDSSTGNERKRLPPAGVTSKYHVPNEDYYATNARIAADPIWTGDLVALAREKAVGQRGAEEVEEQYDLISFYIKTLWSPVLDSFALGFFLEYLALKAPSPSLNCSVRFKLLGGKDSLFPTFGPTSFGWRDAFWYIEMDTWAYLYNVPIYPEEGYVFLDELSKIITDNMPKATFGAYPGCLDDRLDNYNEAYYGVENYGNLREIRRKQASNRVFVFPQCIEDE